jgi:hypothetical protein
MHESSVNFVTFFRDATFKPVQSLNKIETNRSANPAATVRGVRGLMASPLRCSQRASGPGFRESRVEHVCVSGAGSHLPPRATAFALGAGFPYQLPAASTRNLDVHADTSDRTRPRSARHPGGWSHPHTSCGRRDHLFSGSCNHYAHLPRRLARRWRVTALRPAQVLQQQMAGTAFRDGKWLCKGRMSVEMDKNGSTPCR